MPNLITLVDRTIVNYEQSFGYTLNASFNGVEGEIESGEITIFFPSSIDVFLGDVSGPIKAVAIEPVTGGQNVKYTIDAIKNLGVAVRIGLGGLFKVTVDPPQSYIAQPEMVINIRKEDGSITTERLESTAPEVQLVATQDFKVTREVVLPAIDPAAGGAVYYYVTLENVADKGASVDEMIVTIPPVEGITFDTTYIEAGKDASDERFRDTSQDAVVPQFNNGVLTFTMGPYRGHKYGFYYKAFLDDDLTRGDEIVTQATLEVDDVTKDPDTHTIIMGDPVEAAEISVYGPDYTLPNELINYELYVENTGNQELQNVVLIDDLADRIQYTEIQTGSFKYKGINQKISDLAEYSIDYTLQSGQEGQLGPFKANTNTPIILEEAIPEISQGDNLNILEWRLTDIGLGVGVIQENPPQITGRVKVEIEENPPILNEMRLTWGDASEERDASVSTRVEDNVVLQPTFKQVTPKNYFKVGEEIEFVMGLSARRSRIKNPIIAAILPKQFEYVDDSITVEYIDFFEEEVDPPVTPEVRVIENFDGEGRSVVRLTYASETSEYDFNQKAQIKATFKARVRVGAETGSVETFSLLNTVENNGEFIPDEPIYRDEHNIAEDENVFPRYAESSKQENIILFSVSTDSDKKVKGQLDEVFTEEPEKGRTVASGDVEYLITLTNTGNTDFVSVDIVDILPHVGDTGVVETETARQSAFEVYLKDFIEVAFNPEIPEIDPSEAIEIFYSRSYDPVRFGNNFDEIGTVDDWTTELPANLNEIKSFRIKTVEEVQLYPGETLEIRVKGVVPLDVQQGEVAWNSFAAEVKYRDLEGEVQKLLAVEPEKVGILVEPREEDKGVIGGFIWFDEDRDGTFAPGTEGLNGRYVILADEEGNVIDYTITTFNSEGKPGYYSFNNYPLGKYILRVQTDLATERYTKQRLDLENGSKADSVTGYVFVELTEENAEQFNQHTGIMAVDSIQQLLEVNKSARSMLRNVIYDQMLIGMKYEDTIELIKQ